MFKQSERKNTIDTDELSLITGQPNPGEMGGGQTCLAIAVIQCVHYVFPATGQSKGWSLITNPYNSNSSVFISFQYVHVCKTKRCEILVTSQQSFSSLYRINVGKPLLLVCISSWFVFFLIIFSWNDSVKYETSSWFYI